MAPKGRAYVLVIVVAIFKFWMASMVLGDSTLESLTSSVNSLLYPNQHVPLSTWGPPTCPHVPITNLSQTKKSLHINTLKFDSKNSFTLYE
jgi:hypothetical protein